MDSPTALPGVVLEPSLPKHRIVSIDAEAAALFMHQNGMANEAIEQTVLVASSKRPIRSRHSYLTYPYTAVHNQVVTSERVGRNVTVYLGHTEDAIARRDDLDWVGWRRRLDPSANLAEALSYRIDDVTLGISALLNERRKAEIAIFARKATLRLVGALATGVIIATSLWWLNHKNGSGKVETDIAGVLGTALIGVWAWHSTAKATIKAKVRTTIDKKWPADRRAQMRRRQYITARQNGDMPQLVQYDHVPPPR